MLQIFYANFTSDICDVELLRGFLSYTLKTGTPIEDGDSILKFLWEASSPEIQLGWVFIQNKLDTEGGS